MSLLDTSDSRRSRVAVAVLDQRVVPLILIAILTAACGASYGFNTLLKAPVTASISWRISTNTDAAIFGSFSGELDSHPANGTIGNVKVTTGNFYEREPCDYNTPHYEFSGSYGGQTYTLQTTFQNCDAAERTFTSLTATGSLGGQKLFVNVTFNLVGSRCIGSASDIQLFGSLGTSRFSGTAIVKNSSSTNSCTHGTITASLHRQ